jgi:hypothetical protein
MNDDGDSWKPSCNGIRAMELQFDAASLHLSPKLKSPLARI